MRVVEKFISGCLNSVPSFEEMYFKITSEPANSPKLALVRMLKTLFLSQSSHIVLIVAFNENGERPISEREALLQNIMTICGWKFLMSDARSWDGNALYHP